MIQLAFFNGAGIESWQNIWGIWQGLTRRDAEALRRVATMSRYGGKIGYLQSAGWTPHYTTIDADNIFASKWPLAEGVMWTMVNRDSRVSEGAQLNVTAELQNGSFYDCYRGAPLTASAEGMLNFTIEGDGFGCVQQ